MSDSTNLLNVMLVVMVVVLGLGYRILGNLCTALTDLQHMHQHSKQSAGDSTSEAVDAFVVVHVASFVHLSIFVRASLHVPALLDPHISLPKAQAQL
jgi:hypothetical protein